MDKNEERLMNSARILMLEMEENIQNCLQCYRVCLRTFSHLLTLEPDAELANPTPSNSIYCWFAPMFAECARSFMLRFSEFHPRAANLCCVVLPAIPADLGLLAGIDPCRTRVRLNMRGVTASAVRELYALPG